MEVDANADTLCFLPFTSNNRESQTLLHSENCIELYAAAESERERVREESELSIWFVELINCK